MSIIKSVTLEEEIKKNPQLKLSDVQLLKEWCKKQSHLPKVEDSFLALFLHSNYYQIEPTKITIENYYTIRTHLPEIFCNRDPLTEKELRQIFKDIALIRLNGTTKEGYKIIYGKLVNTDSSHYVFTAHLKYSMMLLDLCFLMDGTNNGYTFIADGSKISFGHATRMNPLLLKKSLHYIQEAAPIRLKGLHYINVSPAAEFIMNLAKPFMKKEIIDLVDICKIFNATVLLRKQIFLHQL
ncbi:hypothetical protein PUN28_004180 [Cardiocondyla obscurior]|uniref:CRAL-TRIO domain-containing protein n=1 Tax=Cardiocondyla obscurior TaxID=286306 RepID=A0AAW2GPX5_9HYME